MRQIFYLIPAGLFFISCATSRYNSSFTESESFRNIQQVTSSEEDEFQPSISNDGSTLVFTSETTGNGDIYLKNPPSGKSLQQITFHSAPDRWPVISYDSKKVAFSTLRNGNWDIFIAETSKGQSKIQVTSGKEDEIAPSFSPDGTKLVYMKKSAWDEQWYIWIADLEKGTFTQYGKGMYPKWSPKGDKIAYQKATETEERWFSLWIYDLVNQTETQLTPGEQWGSINPAWIDEGERIAFSTSKMRVFGPIAKNYSSNCNNWWAWTFILPAELVPVFGQMAAFVFHLGVNPIIGKPILFPYTCSVQKRKRINMTNTMDIKYLSGNDIWIIDSDGSNLTQITSHEGNDWYPSVGNDGRLYFNSDRSENIDIWSIDIPETE